MKAMLIPGNGTHTVFEDWFPHITKELEKLGIDVIAKNMPDIPLARRKFWIPFMGKNIGNTEDIILIGWSSGALASMRYMENKKVLGVILVGACHTDLGNRNEMLSGYYDDPWQWNKMKKHSKWIIQFASKDDPFIQIKEPRYIHKKLDTEYYEYESEGHFIDRRKFPEIIDIIKKKLYGNAFIGTIIEESLEDKRIMKNLTKDLMILKTKTEKVTERHKTPWIKQWTSHKVKIPKNQAANIAKRLSKTLDSDHAHAWYADFRNDTHHYIIFYNKVFFVNRKKLDQYLEAKKYGLSLGIPEYQVNFDQDVLKKMPRKNN